MTFAVGLLVEVGVPRWLGIWGVVAGVLEVASAFVLLPPAMPLLLAWLIAIGIRSAVGGAESRTVR